MVVVVVTLQTLITHSYEAPELGQLKHTQHSLVCITNGEKLRGNRIHEEKLKNALK